MTEIKRRGFPYFYTILAVLLVLGVCAVAYGLSLLNEWLADYESSQPKYVAEKVFNEYFANPDIERFIKESDYTLSPAESFEDLKKYVTDQIGTGEISYNETAGSIDGDTLKYVVSAGNHKFAQFTIVDSGEKTEYNNPIYKLGEYDFFYVVSETYSVKIVAPSDATVSVNGFTLDNSYVTETKETESCLHMPSKVLHNDSPTEGIKFSTYVIKDLLYPTEDVRVTDKYGDECKITRDENGSFVADINYDTALEEEYSELAIEFAKGYAKYAQGCGSFGDFGDKMVKESSLYQKIKTLQNQFVHAHDECEFTLEKATEFYRYDAHVFSCRVSFTWHAYRQNAPEAYEYIDMTLYFCEMPEDNGFKIYDMLTHSDFTN